MRWNADFAGLPPIELPDGRKLGTALDWMVAETNEAFCEGLR